jgi:hypothetical protein
MVLLASTQVLGSIPSVAFILAFTEMTIPASLLRTECQCVHNMWITSLKELRHVTHPASKDMLIEELSSLYERASGLLNAYQPQLEPISLSLLQHITSRPLDGHVALAMSNDDVIRAF